MSDLGIIYGIRLRGCETIFYVGQTRQKLQARARKHFLDRHPVSHALRCLGEGNVEFVELERVPLDVLNDREAYWIHTLNTLEPAGMNYMGASSIHVHGRAARKKLSASMKAKCAEPEYLEAIKKRNKALWLDPEYRRKQAEGRAAVTCTEEFKAKISARKKEMWADPERRRAMSEKAKAQWADPEQRALKSQKIREAKSTPENKVRQSEAAKAGWASSKRKRAV
jgi:hypothetical protein